MTAWDELSQEFLNWRQAQDEYERTANTLMMQFYQGFRNYFGSPENPLSEDIINLNKIDDSLEGFSRYIPVEHPDEALVHDSDGGWRFGISLIIGDSWSWLKFGIEVRFTLGECEFELQNANDRTKRFRYNLGEPARLDDAYGYFAGLVRGILRMKPWERSEKRPIGFVVSK